MLSLLLIINLLSTNAPKPPASQRTFAVIVGVSDYKLGQPGKGDLNYSDDDAQLFNEFLRSRAGGNVPDNHIRLLTDHQASRKSILQAMTIFKNATANDRIIFYFSGHGDKDMFLPYDAGPGVVLLHRDVKDAFRQSVAGTKLLLADACMSGTMKEHVYKEPLHPAESNAPRAANANVVVMMSSHKQENSMESSKFKHGVFTHFLVLGAQQEADTSPKDGIVTIKELHNYVWANVHDTAKDQRPIVFGQFDENLAFARLTP